MRFGKDCHSDMVDVDSDSNPLSGLKLRAKSLNLQEKLLLLGRERGFWINLILHS